MTLRFRGALWPVRGQDLPASPVMRRVESGVERFWLKGIAFQEPPRQAEHLALHAEVNLSADFPEEPILRGVLQFRSSIFRVHSQDDNRQGRTKTVHGWKTSACLMNSE